MVNRSYVSTPISDELSSRNTITGPYQSLCDHRWGSISQTETHARASNAMQVLNDTHNYAQAVRALQSSAKPFREMEKDGA
ncbi:hypothetical protein [Ruegeria jejuensis]|uniref:hypothetical protein n=1 Tax=Ruegeria jejuensis TaxID=3233338 RepID=UPI00355B384D